MLTYKSTAKIWFTITRNTRMVLKLSVYENLKLYKEIFSK